MKYSQLTEGIIKIPPTLYKSIEKYVASLMCTRLSFHLRTLNHKMHREPDNEDLKKQELETEQYIKYIQTRNGGNILSPNTFHSIFDHIVDIPFDAQAVFGELPKNLQKDEVLNNLSNIKLQLLFTNKTRSSGYSGVSDKSTGDNIHLIEIKDYLEDGLVSNFNEVKQIIQNMFVTLYHEMQHFCQYEIINMVDSSKKQTQSKKGYHDWQGDDYYASPVEFTTQVGDIGTHVIHKLEDMKSKDELTGDQVKDIKHAMTVVMTDTHSYKKTVAALRNHKEDDRANKALKIIYSMAAKQYSKIANSEPDNGNDYDRTEHDIESKSDIMKSWVKKAKTNGFRVEEFRRRGTEGPVGQGFGLYNPSRPVDCLVSVRRISDDEFHVKLNYNGTADEFDLPENVTNEVLHSVKPEYDKSLSDELFSWLRSQYRTADLEQASTTINQFIKWFKEFGAVSIDVYENTIRIQGLPTFELGTSEHMFTISLGYGGKIRDLYFEELGELDKFLYKVADALSSDMEYNGNVNDTANAFKYSPDQDTLIEHLGEIGFFYTPYEEPRNDYDDYDDE